MSKNADQVARSKKRRKQDFVEMLGGKCQVCGYSRCMDALEFHHVDETTKTINPSIAIYRWSYEDALTEIQKCILLCANCHREYHAKMLNASDIQSSVWYKLTCEGCGCTFDTKRSSAKFCRQTCYAKSRRVVSRPSPDVLSVKRINGQTWGDIASEYGVSEAAVRKWAKLYNL